jgi:hypothetical protein
MFVVFYKEIDTKLFNTDNYIKGLFLIKKLIFFFQDQEGITNILSNTAYNKN